MGEVDERGASEQARGLTDRFGLLVLLLIVAIVSLAAAGDSGLGQIIAVTAMGGSSIVALAVSGVSGARLRLAIGLVVLVAIVAILRRVRTYDRG